MTTTTTTRRIGRQMARAAALVASTPGCPKISVARQISPCPVPSGNWSYGYEPINRAIRAGLIRAEWSGRAYRLYPVA